MLVDSLSAMASRRTKARAYRIPSQSCAGSQAYRRHLHAGGDDARSREWRPTVSQGSQPARDTHDGDANRDEKERIRVHGEAPFPAAANIPREDVRKAAIRADARDKHQAPGCEKSHRHESGDRQRRENESRATKPFAESIPLGHEWLKYSPLTAVSMVRSGWSATLVRRYSIALIGVSIGRRSANL